MVEKPAPRIFVFGRGEVVVGHGVLGGMPCILLTEADTPGEMGSPAPEGCTPLDHVAPGQVILAFETAEGLEGHCRRLESMMETFEAYVAAHRTPEGEHA